MCALTFETRCFESVSLSMITSHTHTCMHVHLTRRRILLLCVGAFVYRMMEDDVDMYYRFVLQCFLSGMLLLDGRVWRRGMQDQYKTECCRVVCRFFCLFVRTLRQLYTRVHLLCLLKRLSQTDGHKTCFWKAATHNRQISALIHCGSLSLFWVFLLLPLL